MRACAVAVCASDVVADCVLLCCKILRIVFCGYIFDGALWDGAANGEGQRKYLEDTGQNSWPEQLEGNVQPDAFPVKEKTQACWMLVNWVMKNLFSRQPREGRQWERGKELEYEHCCCVLVFPCAGVEMTRMGMHQVH
jgi:hypothetical protein